MSEEKLYFFILLGFKNVEQLNQYLIILLLSYARAFQRCIIRGNTGFETELMSQILFCPSNVILLLKAAPLIQELD